MLLFIGGISYGLPWSSVEQDQLRTFIVVSYKKIIFSQWLIINLRRQHGPVVLNACLVIWRTYIHECYPPLATR